MNDLISRQALCEYALNQKDKSVTPNDIMRFPSAQPEKMQLSREDATFDCISRQDAIDAVEEERFPADSDYAEGFMAALDKVGWILKEGLPSAPLYTPDEIQTMQDLEWSQMEKMYELGKAERKKGKWIEDVDRWGDVETTVNGYICSECKVFNTDKDNYCPNCGADMRGEQDETD